MRADIYLPGDDPLNAWALAHTVPRRVEEDEILLAPIEAVILSKLRYYKMGRSDRHLRDIHRMLAISGDQVNGAELARWTTRLGVEREWQEARDFKEP
jgi:hypothetical protein